MYEYFFELPTANVVTADEKQRREKVNAFVDVPRSYLYLGAFKTRGEAYKASFGLPSLYEDEGGC